MRQNLVFMPHHIVRKSREFDQKAFSPLIMEFSRIRRKKMMSSKRTKKTSCVIACIGVTCFSVTSAFQISPLSRLEKPQNLLSQKILRNSYSSKVSHPNPSLYDSSLCMSVVAEESDLAKLNFFNSLTRGKEPLNPLEPGKISMYTCGPTVYDHAHVGNFRAFLTYDVVKRALQYFGYDVDHICNLTDIDDKIIARCDRENISLEDLTNKFAKLFQEDLELLNIIPARNYPRATDHIDEMVQMILDLADNDLAYQSEEGSWYFNVQNKEGYGQQLVNLDVANLKSKASGIAGAQRGAASDADEYDADKVGLQDFALWKAYKPEFDRDDATWDTKIGKGRPGWHLECSAMSKKYLGETIDIHCGGIDLKFPHHENEIAQSEVSSNSASS